MNVSPRFPLLYATIFFNLKRGRRGRDRLVVGFRTTYAINAYHRYCCDFESHSGEVYFICDKSLSVSVTCNRSV